MEQRSEDCQFSRVRSERKHSKTAAEVIKDRYVRDRQRGHGRNENTADEIPRIEIRV